LICFKRVQFFFRAFTLISSKNKGKSGGARVIILVQIIDDLVVLLSIYDKSEKETISDSELDDLINDFNSKKED